MSELYQKMAEILEVPEVRTTDQLKDFMAWDSLAMLSTIAMADAQNGVRLTATDFKSIETIGDLEQRLLGKIHSA